MTVASALERDTATMRRQPALFVPPDSGYDIASSTAVGNVLFRFRLPKAERSPSITLCGRAGSYILAESVSTTDWSLRR